MLAETLLQPKIFLWLIFVGFASGFIYDLFAYIVFLCKNNKIVKMIFDFVSTTLVLAVFFVCILKLDYGDLRFYHIVSFFGALLFQRATLGILIAKLLDWCYNLFVKLVLALQKGAQKIKWKRTDHNPS